MVVLLVLPLVVVVVLLVVMRLVVVVLLVRSPAEVAASQALRFHVFCEEMNAKAVEQLKMEEDLSRVAARMPSAMGPSLEAR